MSGFDFNQASDQRAAVLQNAAGMCADWQTVLSAVRQEMLVRQWSAGDIVPDGDLHRFSTDANRRGDTAGWYIAHSDGVPCVMFGDWRTGEVETVTGLDPELQKTGIPLRVITQRELDEHRAWIETQKKRRETERKTEDQKAREKAYRLYEAAKDVSLADAEKLPYFVKKGIRNAPGARFTENGTILIPMYDETGAPAGIQFIYPDGAKKFISGMAVKSRFGWIVGQGACIYVCEGYATACSVHAATGCSVAIAFSCGNLGPVAEVIHQKQPHTQLVFCADNDQWTRNAKGDPINPGVDSARKAAAQVNGKVIVPEFSSLDGNPTDFNDLMVREGLDAVKLQLTASLAFPRISGWGVSRFTGGAEPQRWLVKDTLPMEAPCILAAPGGTGKGMLALDLALQVADVSSGCAMNLNKSAGKWLGADVLEHGSAVIITAEDSMNDIKRRLHTRDPDGSRRAAAEGRLFIVPLPDTGGPVQLARARPGWHSGYEATEAFEQLAQQLEKIPDLKLVNIDPLASFAGIDINADPQAGQFLQGLLARLAARTGACVLAAHHMSKGKKGDDFTSDSAREAIRGTSALVDGVRLAIAIWPAGSKTVKDVRAWRPVPSHDVFCAAVVKANCEADRSVRILVREQGLLRTLPQTEQPVMVSHAEALTMLEAAVRAAVEAGAPFSAGERAGSGMYARRAQLPEPINSFSRRYLRDLTEELVHSGHLVLCTSGKSIGKWLDTPDGPLAQNEPDYELAQGGIGTAETDMQKSNQNKPEWSHES